MVLLTHHLRRVLKSAPKNASLGRQLFSTTLSQRSKQNLDRELLHSRPNPALSYASSFSEFPMATRTTRELLAQKATEKGNRLAYLFPYQGIKLTFSELKERVDSAAQNLLDLGFQKGDRIAFALPNSVELLILSLAASEIGAISTLMNPAYQKVEFEYMLKKTRAKGKRPSFELFKKSSILIQLTLRSCYIRFIQNSAAYEANAASLS